MPRKKIRSKTLTAIGSKRKVTLDKIGVPTILIFHGENSQEAAEIIHTPIRERYPSPSEVFIASVIDMRIVPRLMRRMAERMMLSGYKDAASHVPDGQNPEDYVVILPDWDGSVTKPYKFQDTHQTAGLVVLDKDGYVVGVYQGESLAENAEKYVEEAMQ